MARRTRRPSYGPEDQRTIVWSGRPEDHRMVRRSRGPAHPPRPARLPPLPAVRCPRPACIPAGPASPPAPPRDGPGKDASRWPRPLSVYPPSGSPSHPLSTGSMRPQIGPRPRVPAALGAPRAAQPALGKRSDAPAPAAAGVALPVEDDGAHWCGGGGRTG